jgi:hypothetical protein
MVSIKDYITEYVSSGRLRNRTLDPNDVITVDDLIMFLDSLNYVRNDSVKSAVDMLEEEGNIYSYIERRGTSPLTVLVRVEALKCVYTLYTYNRDDDRLQNCYWKKRWGNRYENGCPTLQYALKMIYDYARY